MSFKNIFVGFAIVASSSFAQAMSTLTCTMWHNGDGKVPNVVKITTDFRGTARLSYPQDYITVENVKLVPRNLSVIANERSGFYNYSNNDVRIAIQSEGTQYAGLIRYNNGGQFSDKSDLVYRMTCSGY